MPANAIEDVLAQRFRIERPPTLLARAASTPIVFARLRSAHGLRGRSLAVPREEAFAFQVPLSQPFFSGIWIAGKRKPAPSAMPGDTFLFDLRDNPTVGLDNPFDTVRFYIAQATLDELA